MRITIIGCGSIGSRLAKAADEMEEVKRIYLVDLRKEKAEEVAEGLKKGIVVDSVDEELYHTDMVVEATNQEASKKIAPRVVNRGVDIMLMSVGALVDDDYRNALMQAASEHESKIYIPAGALCGVDGLRSASNDRLDSVELISTMRPIDGSRIHGKTTVYSGPARDVIGRYPRSTNVAATVSLLGLGFDKTKVTIIMDPEAKINIHEIHYSGAFGKACAKTENNPELENPTTSHLGALSAVATLKRVCRNEWTGI